MFILTLRGLAALGLLWNQDSVAFFKGLDTGAMLAGTGDCGRVSDDVGALYGSFICHDTAD